MALDKTGGQITPLVEAESGEAVASKATTTNWDANTEFTIPAEAVFLHVYVDQDMYLFADTSTDNPTTAGCVYSAAQTHVIPCRGQTKLHYKSLSAVGNVYVTAFKGV